MPALRDRQPGTKEFSNQCHTTGSLQTERGEACGILKVLGWVFLSLWPSGNWHSGLMLEVSHFIIMRTEEEMVHSRNSASGTAEVLPHTQIQASTKVCSPATCNPLHNGNTWAKQHQPLQVSSYTPMLPLRGHLVLLSYVGLDESELEREHEVD